MSVFEAGCICVTCVDLILPWCDPQLQISVGGPRTWAAPVGPQSTAKSGGHASASLIPPAWEDQNLKPPCASQETRPGTGLLGSLHFVLPGEPFLILPACHFHAAPNLLQEACSHFYCSTTHRKCFITHMPLCACHFPSPPPPQAGQSIAGYSAGLLGMETGEEGKQDCKRESNSTGRN